MRSAMLLLGGLGLLGSGVGVIAAEVPGRWVIGPVLIVAGLAVKLIGLATSEGPDGTVATARRGERQATTLGGECVERPRPGIPAGRAPIRARHAGPRPRPANHPATAATPHRRAS